MDKKSPTKIEVQGVVRVITNDEYAMTLKARHVTLKDGNLEMVSNTMREDIKEIPTEEMISLLREMLEILEFEHNRNDEKDS